MAEKARQLVLLLEEYMQINNWLIFFVYTFFVFGLIFIVIPISINAFKESILGFKQYGFKKAPPETKLALDYEGYAVAAFLVGIFGLFSAIWFLIISEYDNLLNYFKQVVLFFS